MAVLEPARPVMFVGENPCISLFRPGGGPMVATASYWLCSFSEQGEGSVLVIWVDPQASGLGDAAPHAIYADNPELGRMLAVELNQYFGPFRDRGFGTMAPQPARFVQEADGQRRHRIVCRAGATTIELVWEEVLDLFQKVSESTLGGRGYQVANVIGPCARGSILVNGTPVPGEVRPEEGVFRTSAFLAFGESWVRR